MAQEFFIKSTDLETKVRQLLPSQGGLGAGQDLSATTQIVPVIDLTETAEGSSVRADLQTAISYDSATSFAIQNADTTIINNTGYFRIFGTCSFRGTTTSNRTCSFILSDGVTDKSIDQYIDGGTQDTFIIPFDFIVFINAGQEMRISSSDTDVRVRGSTRQIATINGELVDP